MPQALEVEEEDLRPGLVAHYHSIADTRAAVARIDAKPTFTLHQSSPHPRIPPGPFEVVWSGLLQVADRGPLAFDALVCGEATIEVDGVIVLTGRGERESSVVGPSETLDRPRGSYRLKIRYRSLPERSARLQVWWQGPGFAREPLPPWHLKHVAADRTVQFTRDELTEQGRAAVERHGCARCHRSAFPGIGTAHPGPSLTGVERRIDRAWLLAWLADPAKGQSDSRMPALFSADRTGFVERWVLVEHLLGNGKRPQEVAAEGDHRRGQRAFQSVGCAACHYLPDAEIKDQPAFERTSLSGLKARFSAEELAAFLSDPHVRYPDGRMPRVPLPRGLASDLAAYLLLWSKAPDSSTEVPPTADEKKALARRLGTEGIVDTAAALLREKRCAHCHPGLDPLPADDIPITTPRGGCLAGRSSVRYTLTASTRQAIEAYQSVASREKHSSSLTDGQRLLRHLGCMRCHQRDSDRPSPLEAIGSTFGGSGLQYVPFQRAPRLTYPQQKYTQAHLLAAIHDGVSGLRSKHYTYLMPAFGAQADAVVRALAAADGELLTTQETAPLAPADPTLATLAGPILAGFQGYACVSCHVWNGANLAEPDPGAIGTDLTRLTGRIRRDWFDRYLEAPTRSHPGTPMPAIFPRGGPAPLQSVLDGDPGKQKEALWRYFVLGKDAPSPKPPSPLPITPPARGQPPLVAQVPVRLPDGKVVESLTFLSAENDLVVYDLGTMTLHVGYTGAQLLRTVQGRLRGYTVAGTLMGTGFASSPALELLIAGKAEPPTALTLHGYDRARDGARIRWQARFSKATLEVVEHLRLVPEGLARSLRREFHFRGVSAGHALRIRTAGVASLHSITGEVKSSKTGGILQATLTPVPEGSAAATLSYELPSPQTPPTFERVVLADPGRVEGSLERPGYRAIMYPRPKTVSGEDLIMPGALAVHPRDGRVFLASLKTGTLFVLNDPKGDARHARFDDYAGGLFQDALSMLAEPDALYVLHRRNLTRITDTDGDGQADRFDRVTALPHGINETYDYGYGLARDRAGAFVYSYAPYANRHLPGSGGALRLVPGQPPREVAYGFRNPVGWCAGPEGDVFFTDNQGEWVATNKLCHLVEGRFYGFPNPEQKQHAKRPPGKTAVWVPYGWARSINGVAYDNTGGRFGPFAGQVFLAELMFGGAVLRANLEKVNGEYQGACFPFWGKGLLGPVTLAFDPKGPLYVGSITEPGWMAQPDRGALFRIDYTGTVPFEIHSIRALPQGFRVRFTRPVSAATARDPASYQIDHYRYEYTGAYGSPELDRARLPVERVVLSADGLTADLHTAPLTRERVYLIEARGLRSPTGEALVHPTGAYTLNEVPSRPPVD